MVETYKHSGSSGLAGVPVTTLLGVASAFVLAFVYAYAINYIPLVFANFLATIGFGLILGVAVGWATKIGKIRNTLVVGMLALCIGLIALYFAWAIDPMPRFGGEAPMMFAPNALLAYIKVFYAEGFWGIGRGGGANVSGIMLGIVWLIEAAIIVGGTALVACSFTADQPFCEACNQWTTMEEDVARVVPSDDEDKALERLLEGDVSALQDLLHAHPDAVAYVRLDVATCPSCKDSCFLTANMVRHKLNKEGKVEQETTALIKNMIVDETDIALVRDGGREPPDEPDEQEGRHEAVPPS